MIITRNTILNAILGRSGVFPNCHLKGYANTLEIHLFNSVGKVAYIFKTKIENLKGKTYFKIYEYLLNNPQIKLVSEYKSYINRTIEV